VVVRQIRIKYLDDNASAPPVIVTDQAFESSWFWKYPIAILSGILFLVAAIRSIKRALSRV
jgi:hypothetical protein